jgi:hypothetical protein
MPYAWQGNLQNFRKRRKSGTEGNLGKKVVLEDFFVKIALKIR